MPAAKRLSFWRDASDRLTFEVFDAPADSYPELCEKVVRRFKLTPANQLIVGLDEMFQDYASGDFVVGLEWDNWSGFIVVAKSPECEPLVREIAAFLSEN